jgi:hypothetical protein
VGIDSPTVIDGATLTVIAFGDNRIAWGKDQQFKKTRMVGIVPVTGAKPADHGQKGKRLSSS